MISDCSLSDLSDSSVVGSACAYFLGGDRMGVRVGVACKLT